MSNGITVFKVVTLSNKTNGRINVAVTASNDQKEYLKTMGYRVKSNELQFDMIDEILEFTTKQEAEEKAVELSKRLKSVNKKYQMTEDEKKQAKKDQKSQYYRDKRVEKLKAEIEKVVTIESGGHIQRAHKEIDARKRKLEADYQKMRLEMIQDCKSIMYGVTKELLEINPNFKLEEIYSKVIDSTVRSELLKELKEAPPIEAIVAPEVEEAVVAPIVEEAVTPTVVEEAITPTLVEEATEINKGFDILELNGVHFKMDGRANLIKVTFSNKGETYYGVSCCKNSWEFYNYINLIKRHHEPIYGVISKTEIHSTYQDKSEANKMVKSITRDPGVVFSSSCKYDKMNLNNISMSKKKAMIKELGIDVEADAAVSNE